MAISNHLPKKSYRLANNLLTEQAGVAALDAAQGKVLDDKINNLNINTEDFALKSDPVFLNSISLGRNQNSTIGSKSIALGNDVIASGNNSHAEGNSCTASGNSSHAEGYNTEASGNYSHTEGFYTRAKGESSHAEGYNTEASGEYSHVSGEGCIAIQACGFVIGSYNIQEGKPNFDPIDSPVFIIGSGPSDNSRRNTFKIYGDGRVYTKTGGSYNTSGADYGEFFEWLDGNSNAEDRIGYFVTLERDKIKIANEGDYILGAVSGISGVIGNSDEHYTHRWKTDEFGRLLTEQKTFQNEVTKKEYTAEVNIENEDYVYEQDLKYTHRAERKEWDVVGMLGQIIVRDDGTCKVNHYCTVADGGIATATDDKTGYRVVERITDNIIKIIIR